MERLNYFNPYISKSENHEDRLTRSFLVLLKYSPSCLNYFYESIKEEVDEEKLLSSSSLLNEDIQFKTQVGSIQFETETLLSVLITNDKLTPQKSIEPIDRGAVYDGIITLGGSVSIIIETKPNMDNVWENQLCPSKAHLGEDIRILKKPVILTWASIIKWLNEFTQSSKHNYTEKLVASDFLSLVQSNFSYLNPYDRYSYCKGNDSLILKRTENLLKSIVKDDAVVRYHQGWGYFIETLNFKSIRKIGLIYNANNKWLDLSFFFGDTQGQARAYYPTPVKISDFKDKGWIVYGNFHLATVASNLVYFHPKDEDLEKYIKYWNSNGKELKQIRGHNNLKTYLNTLYKESFLPNNDDDLENKIFSTRIENINICPGIGFVFRYDLKELEKLDVGSILQKDLIDKIKFCIKQNIEKECNFLKDVGDLS
ncbi:hypothetical protein [Leeuwenhoekiella sp. CH_XMU1409-2]|uniref:hypothetical protein n=1 Tax=Leeuwenhoekiella sp. CH_XMU1409-2 TaxID=3107768 RepID=UPI00300B8CC6